MQRIDGVTIISPTDLANHLACKHLTWLNLKSLDTGIAPRKLDDDLLEVLKSYGEEHEATYLAALEASLQSLKRTVVDLDARRDKDSAYTRDELMKRMSTTVAAMKSGPDALYQPTFYSEKDGFGWVGRADFLVAVDEIISDLGNYAFQPYDTKLARIAKVNALIQLCAYAEQIQGVQGLEPEFIHVVTGSEEEGTVSVRLSEVSAYYRRVKQSLVDALLKSPEHSEPVPNEHCDVCRWRAECKAYWRKADDLAFVAGMSATNREKLRAVGITKLEELANRNEVKTDINPDVLSRLRKQATLQLITKSKQEIDPETLPETEFIRPVERGRGFSLLPEKNAGDIFYDIEGHAYRGSKGLEYLHGLAWVDTDGTPQYKAIWAHDAEEERKALIEVIEFINSRIAMPDHENLRIYHFGHYEPSALKRLATRHVTCETELSKLLREGRFVDLSRIVT
ncbi:MAG: TM0106 family RecB-like putative nuclease, partial [Actinomycetota bacterium]